MSEESARIMKDEEIGLNFFTEGEPRTPDGLPSVFGVVDQAEMLARIDEIQDDDLASSFFADSLIEVEEAATRVFDVGVRPAHVPAERADAAEPVTVDVVVSDVVLPEVVEAEPIVVEEPAVAAVATVDTIIEHVVVEQRVVEETVIERTVIEETHVESVAAEAPSHETAEPAPVLTPDAIASTVVEESVVESRVEESYTVETTVVAKDAEADGEGEGDGAQEEEPARVSRLGAAREEIVAMRPKTVITVPGILAKSADARRSFILGGPAAVDRSDAD